MELNKLNEDQRNEIANQIRSIVRDVFGKRINFLTVLFAIFATLKLTGYISWSWWWVTAPLWGGIALSLLFLILVIIILFLIFLISK